MKTETNYLEVIPSWEDEVGRVNIEIHVSNDRDLGKVEEGSLPKKKMRQAKIQAIVDTGATLLVLPEQIVQQLGLPKVRTVTSRFADGRRMERIVYGPVRLEVQGRVVNVDALSGPPGVPALLGQIPLEGLDFLVDAKNQKLIPNPESPNPDMAMVDVF